MIAEFNDSVTGTVVYISPAYVVTLRPDPAEPLQITLVKPNDGESIRVHGEAYRCRRQAGEIATSPAPARSPARSAGTIPERNRT